MSFSSLRDALALLERNGLLKRVSKPVDVRWEPACFAKWAFQSLPERDRFGLWFENVTGYDMPVVTGAMGASTAGYALLLGVAPEGINGAWERALTNPLAPVVTDEAPCQEIVLPGAEARLDLLPIPTWTPGKDVGPYITTPVLTRHADSGVQNLGVYRTRVRDPRHLVANLSPGRQGLLNARTWHAHGKPAPIAWIVGAEPAVQFASTANLPWGGDELAVAGGLLGRPVALVRARTVDLMVPAEAEIVIEGEVWPGETDIEGPFGEFAGYMGPVSHKPLVRVTAITRRRRPIWCAMTSQMPPSESTVVQSLTNGGVLQKLLRHDLGEYTVSDVAIDLNFGGLLGHAVVAMTPRYPGHAKKVGRMVADCTPLKRVTVVDADVDIRDPLHLDWAMNARFDPARDSVIIDDVYFPMGMDPSIRASDGGGERGSKMVIDATQKTDAGPFSLPAEKTMMKALESWRAAGLPEFEIPRRVRFRLAGS